MLSITRKIGSSFALTWPNGVRRDVKVVGSRELRVTADGGREYFLTMPCVIGVRGSELTATLSYRDVNQRDRVRINVEAPLAISVERDDVKSGRCGVPAWFGQVNQFEVRGDASN